MNLTYLQFRNIRRFIAVEKVVKISKELGRDIASPHEARKILGLD